MPVLKTVRLLALLVVGACAMYVPNNRPYVEKIQLGDHQPPIDILARQAEIDSVPEGKIKDAMTADLVQDIRFRGKLRRKTENVVQQNQDMALSCHDLIKKGFGCAKVNHTGRYYMDRRGEWHEVPREYSTLHIRGRWGVHVD